MAFARPVDFVNTFLGVFSFSNAFWGIFMEKLKKSKYQKYQKISK